MQPQNRATGLTGKLNMILVALIGGKMPQTESLLNMTIEFSDVTFGQGTLVHYLQRDWS